MLTKLAYCDAADPSQAAAVESHRDRERAARYFTNFGLKVGMVGKVKFEVQLRSTS